MLQQQVQASCCIKVQTGISCLMCKAVLYFASCCLKAIMELPPINMAEVLYGQHPKLGDGLICTAVSLAGVLFNFVVMPSLDLLLGKDLHSRTQVRRLHPGQVPGRVLLSAERPQPSRLVPPAVEPAGQQESAASGDRQVLQPVVPSDTSGAHSELFDGRSGVGWCHAECSGRHTQCS